MIYATNFNVLLDAMRRSSKHAGSFHHINRRGKVIGIPRLEPNQYRVVFVVGEVIPLWLHQEALVKQFHLVEYTVDNFKYWEEFGFKFKVGEPK